MTNERWNKLHAEAEKFYADNDKEMNGLDEIQKATNFAIHAMGATPQPVSGDAPPSFKDIKFATVWDIGSNPADSLVRYQVRLNHKQIIYNTGSSDLADRLAADVNAVLLEFECDVFRAYEKELNDYSRRLEASEAKAGDAPKVEAKQLDIDISNLRFYSRMAEEHDWDTVEIGNNVIVNTLHEIAERLAILRPYFPPASQTNTDAVEELAKAMHFWYGISDGSEESDLRWVWSNSDTIKAKWIPRAKEFIANLATPASTARTDGWVSVEERLPEDERNVLVFCQFGSRIGWRKIEGIWRELGDQFKYELSVTHWRELPAAPGSVPQAPESPKKPYCVHCGVCHFRGENTLCDDGVPQAEPPK